MMHHKCTLLRDSTSHLPKLLPHAAWYKKLWRNFQKSLLISPKHPEVYIYLNSSTAIEKESLRQVTLKNWVIHPLSAFRQYWNLMIFFVMLFHQGMTAFVIGFYGELGYESVYNFIIIDMFFCSILLIEIILAFRTGVIIEATNEIILDPIEIASKRFYSTIIDTINALPFVFITTFIVDVHNTSINGTLIIYMVILMLYFCFYFNRMLSYCSTLPLLLNISEQSSIILFICIRTAFLIHWGSCVRRLVPLYIKHQSIEPTFSDFKDLGDPTKFYIEQQVEEKEEVQENFDIEEYTDIEDVIINELEIVFQNYTMIHMYLRSLLITMRTAFQAGYGYETSDSMLIMSTSTLIILGGWIYSAYVTIIIVNIIVASSNSGDKFEELMQDVDAFCDSKELSDVLRDRIKTFLKRRFNENYFNEDAIKHSTPPCLKKEIMMSKCSNLVARVPLFKEIPPLLLEKIISCLQFQIYFPADVIIKADDLGDAMYFIVYGTAAILSASGNHLQTICDGSHFGEIALLTKGQKRTATVVSLEICEIYKLSQRDFNRVIEPHREIVNRIKEIAHERIKSMLQSNKNKRFSVASSSSRNLR